MKKTFKRILVIMLVVVMTIGIAPLSGFVGLELPEFGGFKKLADSVSEFFDGFGTKAKATETSGICGDDLTWDFNESTGVLTISGTGDMYDWTYSSLPQWRLSDIKSVSIDNRVTSIGDYAFCECTNLTSVTIPDNVTKIGRSAFAKCGLTSVIIGNSVAVIGDSAFIQCTNLINVNFPDSVTSIGDDAFRYCDSLIEIVLPQKLKSIGADTFHDCDNLETVIIPNGVVSIGMSAFRECYNLGSVVIPESVKDIGEHAFLHCLSLTKITVDSANTEYSNDEYGVLFNKDRTELFQYPLGNARIHYIIPESVIHINSGAFSGSANLMDIVVPSNITSIDEGAFGGCSGLTNIKIPNSVTSIGASAFYDCRNLANIIIPDSVRSIGDSAFYHCDSFTDIIIPDSVTDLDSNAFEFCMGLRNITIGNGISTLSYGVFYDCISLTSVTIPDSVKTIYRNAFYACTNLTDVHYTGSKEQWNEIEITSDGNSWLFDATIHFNCSKNISDCKQGDIIEFGWYPQSEVTDSGIISELNSLTGDNKSWDSYGYYIGSGTGRVDGQMKPGDYMRYKDVVYGSNKYRGVVFDTYRPDSTGSVLPHFSHQEKNGYHTETVYWFKYEPVKWRVLDPATGMVMSEIILDSQAYNNFILVDGTDEDGDGVCWGDSSKTYYANNYAKSSIREWLNKDFYNTTFSTAQQGIIEYTALDNTAHDDYFSAYDSETTYDKIYLLSYDDALNTDYSFSTLTYNEDTDRRAQGSNYAICQGLGVNTSGEYEGNSFWHLRSAGTRSDFACMVSTSGGVCNYFYCTHETRFGVRPALNLNLNSEVFQSDVKDIGKSSADGRGAANTAGGGLDSDFVFSKSDYTQTHVIDSYSDNNDKYEAEYLFGNAVAMDGTGGFVDLCVPGLTKDDNMVPQGITYYPEKDWIMISAYSKSENVPSVIYALDKSTGKYVAQFDVFNGNKIFTGKLGGIAVSNNNLYFSNGKSISYIPLSEFNVAYGTKKIVDIKETVSFAKLFGEASVSYVSFSDGVLYAGNFYNETEDYKKPVFENIHSIVIGYNLSGLNSDEEWEKITENIINPDYHYVIPNSITEIQCALVKNGNLYLSCSYGRKNESRLYVVEVGNAIDITIKDAGFSCLAPPMMEGITFIGDELYAVFESGAYFYREKSWYNKAKNPTDVVWKIDCESLLDENKNHFSIGDCENYNVLYGKGIISVSFKQSWFADNSLQYNHNLAQLCSKFVTLGYNTDSLKSGLKALGFNSDRIFWETKAEKDKVDTFIADRNITVNGETYTLLFVGCIGTNTVQWYSNFEPGTDETHASFNDAKNYVYGKIQDYIDKLDIDPSKTKILLCGHSRGAATANILSAKLIDEEFFASKENIYTYTFATPNPTSSANRFDEKYNRIFNFVNPEDFVTKVIPSQWGYGRYGKTYALPSKTNTEANEVMRDNMQDMYDVIMNDSKYHPYPGGEEKTYNVVNKLTNAVKSIGQLYSKKFVWLGEWKSIQEFFTETLCKFMANNEEKNETEKAQKKEAKDLLLETWLNRISDGAILSLTDYFVWYQGIGGVTGGVLLDDYFQEAHQAETYCAYMMSMTASQALTVRESYRNTVNCPVDIEVYNKVTGELVGKIVNNTIDEEVAAKENAISMSVDGDSKSFWLPSDGEYDVRLTGNDDGTMDYSVSVIDSADSNEIQRINFFDIEIQNGISMNGEFSGEEFILDEYALGCEEKGTIEPTEKLEGDSLKDISISITTEGVGCAYGDITVTSGDYVTLTAKKNEGNDFIGWYENDILVSSDAEYSFVAKENRNLVAKFTSRYVIQWNIEGETIVTYCEAGDKINSPAVPVKDGYVFTGWTPAVPEVMTDYDLTFTAVFEACEPSFSVTCPECGEKFTDETAYDNHIVTHNKPAKITIIGGKITNGELVPSVTITIIAEQVNGKIFSHWVVEGATVADANSPETTIVLGNRDVTITAEYDDCGCKCHQGGIIGFFYKIILFFQKLFGNNLVCFCGAKH